MSTLPPKAVSLPRMASGFWRPWTVAPRYSRELQLLERRVVAARFGINFPRHLGASSAYMDSKKHTMPALLYRPPAPSPMSWEPRWSSATNVGRVCAADTDF